mmetsp:Transcript_13521/g.39350  ORF Transcript_13521/g.39350 Transcript_13521/m.39350 type:complete len:192 (-) Transcript_13521:40-615(-)
MGCCFSQSASPGTSSGAEAVGLPEIGIPASAKGKDVVVDNANLSISGSGSALASAPIEQDRAYWEVKVVDPGSQGRIRVGVSRRLKEEDLHQEIDEASQGDKRRVWSFQQGDLKAGDVVGVTFGQSDLPNLSFLVNGEPQPAFDVKKIGGLVYPIFSVGQGATLRVVFDPEHFEQQPPPAAKPLMVVRSLL